MSLSLEDFMEKALPRKIDPVDKADKIRETPCSTNNVHYPAELHNRVMRITATARETVICANIIIATQSKGYTEEMFNDDVIATCEFFGINKDDKTQVQTIFLKPVKENEEVLDSTLDSAKAVEKIRTVVNLLNSGSVTAQPAEVALLENYLKDAFPNGDPPKRFKVLLDTMHATTTPWLRIVSLGVKFSGFVYQSFEYLLNEWHAPYKNVQFVTNGETNDHGFLTFWKSACIMELCTSVEYVTLSDYLPFGYFKGKCKKLYKMKVWGDM